MAWGVIKGAIKHQTDELTVHMDGSEIDGGNIKIVVEILACNGSTKCNIAIRQSSAICSSTSRINNAILSVYASGQSQQLGTFQAGVQPVLPWDLHLGIRVVQPVNPSKEDASVSVVFDIKLATLKGCT